ncbi:tRNA-specific adenosine deaminase 1 isoform X2 [Vanessa atalanta]|uniref:tRNA-specific adenosine deaminase 1 isoform X2 n=1 Tax=Vanessa atalanta TaxID=42275 RepID=UPI001FCD52DF|nr:tRNA-specific adenosine deaminase 1 isoform X2 [Vanessa atalanta]
MPNICADTIAEKCINLYEKLPKSGKPIENEWTVLSCVVQYDKVSTTYDVVSLGTGSKCIGASKMSPAGNILNDSHAETFARRGFLIYLYENIINTIENKQSIFHKEEEKFRLRENIEFIFYSSQMPCGDASIMTKMGEEDDYGYMIISSKREAQDDNCDIESKRQKLDIHRTGAKCLPNTEQDPKMPGVNYHLLGQVRTKPGRGDRTLSVSCSDKMARWIHVGIQGALLDILLSEPIFIRCSKIFPDIRGEHKMRPAAGSIIWIKTSQNLTEVAVHGQKLGVTKKKANSLSGSLCISKYNIYKKFHEVLLKQKTLCSSVCGEELLCNIEYNNMKRKAIRYKKNWHETRDTFFKIWTSKPDFWNFCLNKTN